MARVIRKHLRDFIAVTVLLIVALVATYIIVQQQRLRIPILEEKPFTLHADFENAQGVVAGQGQTIDVAGVRVGDVSSISLDHGVADVTFAIDRKFLPIYKNATILLRPRTGLQDMFFELDPGTKSAGVVPDGGTIPAQNTAPTVNLDQILEALDSDTQAYLRLLLVGAGEGFKGRDKDLGKLLGGLGPINRDLNRLNSLVAERRRNLADLIHNFSVLTKDIGDHSGDLNQLIVSSNSALSAIAADDPDVQRATAELPGTLAQIRDTLTQVDAFAQQAGPTFTSLLPFARNLDNLNASVESLGKNATPVIKNKIRPLVRAAEPAIAPLRTAAARYAKASPKLTTLGSELNRLANMAAYNPNGAEDPGTPGRDEGYLYWAAWLGHIGDTVFQDQDANGLYRRIYFTVSCANAANMLSNTPLSPIILPLSPLFVTGGPCNPGP
jgi:phospholipid/cholesterol/gamma-HCH transport system substrate-binding protein